MATAASTLLPGRYLLLPATTFEVVVEAFTAASSAARSWRAGGLSATVATIRRSVLWPGCILEATVDAPLCHIAAARFAARLYTASSVASRIFRTAVPAAIVVALFCSCATASSVASPLPGPEPGRLQ